MAGLDPPPPTASVGLYRRCAFAALLASSALITTLGGLKQSWDYVAAMMPDANAEAAWAAIRSDTDAACGQLQAFVRDYPGSAHNPAAQAALAKPVVVMRWALRERPV
ncbi:hypothetical protein IP88_16350, partial [alpha proteobacterium AAP81b]